MDKESTKNFKDWLNKVDTSSANLPALEKSLFSALSKKNSNSKWIPSPIAPLAEPVNLDDMTGDLARNYSLKISNAAEKTDQLFNNLVSLNNVLASELESAEKSLMKAADDVQAVTSLTQDQTSQYVWIAESFNDNIRVDSLKTTALIDTDFGQITLAPKDFATIQGYNADIPGGSLVGIPGCNLLVLDLSSPGSADKGPEPTLEKAETTNLSAIFDNNSATWFEMERNFIPKSQPLRLAGRSLVYELGAQSRDVIEATKDYDWRATIVMPDGTTKVGSDGKGELIAEFIGDTDPRISDKNDTQMEIKLTLTTPQPLSEIRLHPFIRPNQGEMVVERIDVVADGQTILVVKDRKLNVEQTSLRTLEKEVLRRTGTQSVGATFEVPTDRNISTIHIRLRGKPSVVKGLAHPFAEEEVETKTTRKFLFIPSTSTKREWNRKPISEAGRTIGVSNSNSNILGSLGTVLQAISGGASSTLSTLSGVGGLLSSITANPAALNLGAKDVSGINKALGGLGKIGSAIGSVIPIVSTVLSVGELVNAAFGTSRSSQVIGQASGYDIFKGYRSYIAIRDVNLLRVTYEGQSEYVSKKLIFPRKVTKIGILADYKIPTGWAQGEWVQFFLSIDGVNWTQVLPLSDTTLEKSLVLSSPVDAVYVKSVIRGNVDDVFRSPKIQNIALQGLPVN